MAKQIFTNGASAELAVSIDNSATTIQVQAGYGALFPSPTDGEWFIAVLEDANGNYEVVKCTARSTDLLTVTRAQESTSAASWTNTVTRVELRNTKGSMQRMLQRDSDALTGDLDCAGYTLLNAVLDESAVIDTRTIFPVGLITLWAGSVASIPQYWKLCDGANGTPDLRSKFVRGAGTGGSYENPGDTGGADTDTLEMSTAGAHEHTVTVADHVLTTAEMPAHTHNTGYRGSNASTSGNDQDFITDQSSVSRKGNVTSTSTGGDGAHGHPGSTVDSAGGHAHTATVDTVPAYYALAYIMFTGA